MTTLTFKLTFTGALLSTCSMAGAHPGHHAAVSGYHYLASPDHVVVFALLGLGALSLLMYHVRGAKGKVKRKPN